MKLFSRTVVALVPAALFSSVSLFAQRTPGRSIGKVDVVGNLIHIELDTGVVAPERLLDLDHHTLRFTPEAGGYGVQMLPLQWDSAFGEAAQGTMALKNFQFPFSGKSWDSFNIATGAITFGGPAGAGRRGGAGGGVPAGNRTGAGTSNRAGFALERYASMQTVGSTFINTVPGIAADVKVDFSGQHFAKELADRAVVTWTLTEPSGGIQAFSWTPTVNRIQAVLHKDGTIDLSYNDMTAKDGIVGVFPMVNGGVSAPLGSLSSEGSASAPENLDIKKVDLSSVDGLFLKATIITRGAIPADGAGATYRIALDKHKSAPSDLSKATVVWTIRSGGAGRRGGGGGGGAGAGAGAARYTASGPGSYPEVTVSGDSISVQGILPEELAGATSLSVSADASAGGQGTAPVAKVAAKTIALKGIHEPEQDLSKLAKGAGPFPVVYEGFHWLEIPRSSDVACTVIKALGDKFDFIASYSDFRVDNPEGGTPSTGPRGGNVTGIGTTTNGLQAYCSQGEMQWMFVEPVSTSAIQMQRDAPDGRMKDYNYAMSQIGHELAHRWMADADALVNGERIPLGPVHWATGLQIPAAFPYSKPVEADAMGGGVWKDNGDGTFTQLDDDYYVPANGYSWLDLYLMGFAKADEVPDFFIVRNLQRTQQKDSAGHPIYKGTRTNITIKDVIAQMGPREPDVDHSQKKFNTAMVIMTLPGKKPTQELISSVDSISAHWIQYWSQSTGGRSTMTTNPK